MSQHLANLNIGSSAVIRGYIGDHSIHERLKDLGFVEGAVVQALFRAPLGGLSIFRVDNTTVALRDEEASCLRISLIAKTSEIPSLL